MHILHMSWHYGGSELSVFSLAQLEEDYDLVTTNTLTRSVYNPCSHVCYRPSALNGFDQFTWFDQWCRRVRYGSTHVRIEAKILIHSLWHLLNQGTARESYHDFIQAKLSPCSQKMEIHDFVITNRVEMKVSWELRKSMHDFLQLLSMRKWISWAPANFGNDPDWINRKCQKFTEIVASGQASQPLAFKTGIHRLTWCSAGNFAFG